MYVLNFLLGGKKSRASVKRVVFFTPGLSEPGGAGRRSSLIIEGFVQRGWDVKVVTRAGTLRRFAIRKQENLFILEVPGFSSVFVGGLMFLLIAVPLGLTWGVRARAFLAIQFGSQATAAGICAGLNARPYFALGSSTGPLSELRLVLGRHTGRLRQGLLVRAAVLVAQTEDGAQEIRSLVPGAITEVVPTPVQLADPPPLNGLPHALFTGRLSEEKDLDRLLIAWREIAAGRPSARLTLAGSGGGYRSVEDQLRQRVNLLSLHDSVSFTGWVSSTAMLLASNDVFVFPSVSEGMSNALLEALAARRVIVASDIPANRAVLGDDYPLLFKTSDITEMVDALSLAFDDETARTNALGHIDKRMHIFSVDKIVDRLEGMVEDAYRTHSKHS